MTTSRIVAAVAVLLAATSTAAAPAIEDAGQHAAAPDLSMPLSRGDDGSFVGPRYRYDSMWVMERAAWDVLAIPAGAY